MVVTSCRRAYPSLAGWIPGCLCGAAILHLPWTFMLGLCKPTLVRGQEVCRKGSTCTMATKVIKEIMPAPRPHWVGNGFYVYPVFNHLAFSQHVSPFLMFDYAAPKWFEPTTQRRGVGRHPHRGFETVTIAFEGEVEHGDSMGNRGVIGPGDVQWMTAASGIVHEEYHAESFAKTGGTFEMCQLWVNLPQAYKMTAPKYQAILAENIPELPLWEDDAKMLHGRLRIIAGSYNGVQGPASTFTPINLWDVQLPSKGRSVELNLPERHNTLIFVRRGSLKVGLDGLVGPQGMVQLEMQGSVVRLEASEPRTQLLLLGGEPIDEPIAHRGPFVMNTAEELAQASSDYQSGKMG
mmetsp:Transcript_97591/g.173803  ORF Transcript_97591/g.173803 Transcript_97591/m.173803 type:complete len:350 (-) Transcript_97591:27-1076(-)